MKYISFPLLIVTLFASSALYSQSKSKAAKTIWGDDVRMSKRTFLNDIVGQDDDGIYAVQMSVGGMMRSGKILLERYDSNMNLSLSKELELEHNGDDLRYEGVRQLDEKLYLFSSYTNDDTEKNYLFYQPIDHLTLMPKGDVNPIGEIDFSEAKRKRRNQGNYTVLTSDDDSKLIAFYNLPFEKEGDERFAYSVFDSDMEKISENTIELKYQDELFSLYDYELSNDGDFYLLGKIYEDKVKNTVRGEPNYTFSVFRYAQGTDEVIEYKIDGGERFLTDFTLRVTEDNDLICAGFYSDKATSLVGGSFYMKIDGESKKVIAEDFSDFELDFITQNLTEKQEKKAKKKAARGKEVELFEYDLDEIILREDGGAVLIGEQYYVRVSTSTITDANGGTRTTTTYHYYYNDIIVISISPDGKIEWKEKIAKRQHSTNDSGYFSSYVLMVDDDKLRFIFNDNGENLFYKDGDKIHNFTRKLKRAMVSMVTMDSRGVQKREALFTALESGVLVRPKVSEQVSDDELVIYGQWKKYYRFAKMKF